MFHIVVLYERKKKQEIIKTLLKYLCFLFSNIFPAICNNRSVHDLYHINFT